MGLSSKIFLVCLGRDVPQIDRTCWVGSVSSAYHIYAAQTITYM